MRNFYLELLHQLNSGRGLQPFQIALPQKQPVYFVSDDSSDSDVIPLSSPPPEPVLPTEIIEIKNQSFQVPVPPKEVEDAFREACRIDPELSREKVCSILDLASKNQRPNTDLLVRILMEGADGECQDPKYSQEVVTVLSALFPNIYVTDIRNTIKEAKGNFRNAYSLLCLNKKLLKKTRTYEKPVIVEKIPLALDLMELYEDDQNRLKEERKAKEYERAKVCNELIPCECCFEDCLLEDMAQCQNGHLFCSQCLNRTIETIMGEGRTDIRCLSIENCGGTIPMSELERVVPKQTLNRLFTMETDNAVIAADLFGLVKCHRCGYKVIVDGSGVMKCPECGNETCTGCGRAAHPGKSCDQFAEIDKDRIVEEQMNESGVRVCPKCQAHFIKDEGCNKMECPRCHTWICYWCKKEIPRDVGYCHFWRSKDPCPPNRCPLWVSNSTLHRIEALHAGHRTKESLQDS